MSTHLLADHSDISLDSIPELSRLAWDTLRAQYPCGEDLKNTPSADGLLLSKMPGSSQLIGQTNDEWVLRYQDILETLAKKQRKQGQPQSGVFYTPVPVAAYLTRRSLGVYLDEQRANIQALMRNGQVAAALALLEVVRGLKVIDPACGTGVFLMEALKVLSDFYQQVNQIDVELVTENPARHVFLHQLYGVDIDPLSVMIAECRLLQWVHRLDASEAWLSLASLPSQIRWGNTMQQEVFSHTHAWDFILGNPPYVSEVRKQSGRFQPLQNRQGYYQPKMDLCDAFLAWGVEHLSPKGHLVYVLPEYRTQRTSTADLRKHLWRQGAIREFWSFQDSRLFKNAPGHHSSFLIWQKNNRESKNETIASEPPCQATQMGFGCGEHDLDARQLKSVVFTLNQASGKLLYGDSIEMGLMDKLSALEPLLNQMQVQQGIVLPQGRLKKQDRERLLRETAENIPEHAGIFLLDAAEVRALALNDTEQQLLKPYFQPAGFLPFQGFKGTQPDYYLIYGNAQNRTLMENAVTSYPQIRKHLDRFRPVLTSDFAPYGLHRARQPIWFEDARKILCPRQVMVPSFAVIEFPAYVNEGFYSVRTEADPFLLCALLNSTLGWYWFYKQKRKGHRLQIDKDVLLCFPKPTGMTDNVRSKLSALAQELSDPKANQPREAIWSELNSSVYESYGLTETEIAWVQSLQALILKGR
ncbi:MAG: hypothetical protein K0Q50_47 [Vampirovibrio sp.]|nr:hypothetical protein [Vampirovibrio sp.]